MNLIFLFLFLFFAVTYRILKLELFLLDMGKPVNIYELAKRMVKLSGKTVKDSENLNGEIEIIQKE